MKARKRAKSNNQRMAVIVGLLVLISVVALYVIQQNRATTPKLPEPPLQDLAARHDIELGNFAMRGMIDETPYRDILIRQFHFVLADNTPNWYFTDGGLRPTKDTFNFKQMDEVVNFAKEHSMPIQAHHFVWGEEKWLPDWLKSGNFTKQELLALMRDHILTVGKRYRGQIREWTVVNEAFTRDQGVFGLRDWWGDNIGDQSFIDKSFQWARQADPKAKLILNDFNNEGINKVSNAMYTYIKKTKARGVPIDGVGMQMHIDGTHPPTQDEVTANMNRFAKLGVDVYVTEFDVNMADVPGDNKTKDQVAGRIYYEMMRACIEAKNCQSFAYLGITDKETWYNYMGLKDPRPLMFDNRYQPKPAYFSTRDALNE